jgi:hypothetical protein
METERNSRATVWASAHEDNSLATEGTLPAGAILTGSVMTDEKRWCKLLRCAVQG